MANASAPRSGFLITDSTSRVLFTTADVETRYGFSVPEVIGKRPQDLWGGQMGKDFYANFWKGIAERYEPHIGRMLNRHKAGRSVELEIQVAPLLDESGKPHFFIETHPEDSGDERAGFTAAFETAFNPHTGSPVLQAAFLEAYLGCSVDPSQVRSREDLLNALRNQCIVPVQDRFRRRIEDRELVELAQKNSEAFSSLYSRYASVVRRFFTSRIKAGADTVEDMTQEVFLRAYRALPVYRPSNASYLTYLLRIAHNLLVNHYRLAHPSISLDEGIARSDMSLEGFLDLTHAVSMLSATDQAVLRRFYENGSSVRDIAVELGRSENAIKLILSRARRKLRGFLQ